MCVASYNEGCRDTAERMQKEIDELKTRLNEIEKGALIAAAEKLSIPHAKILVEQIVADTPDEKILEEP